MSDYQIIVVPYDFSAHAKRALSEAADLARRFGGELHVLHVIQPPVYAYAYGPYGAAAAPPPIDTAGMRRDAMKSLEEVANGLADPPKRVQPHVVEATSIASAIRESAEDLGADLIVMGTHGRTGLAHVFLGSVAERTLRGAPCPVLTVQAPEAEEEEGRDR